jgi:hypothetical protein
MKVPLSRNIGVMNRKAGKLKKSMLGAKAVKHMAIAENSKPPKKATTGIRRTRGLVINPNAAIMASKVFWKYIRTNDA